jgi:hypothetical protein
MNLEKEKQILTRLCFRDASLPENKGLIAGTTIHEHIFRNLVVEHEFFASYKIGDKIKDADGIEYKISDISISILKEINPNDRGFDAGALPNEQVLESNPFNFGVDLYIERI